MTNYIQIKKTGPSCLLKIFSSLSEEKIVRIMNIGKATSLKVWPTSESDPPITAFAHKGKIPSLIPVDTKERFNLDD